jgi:hypothetical protein
MRDRHARRGCPETLVLMRRECAIRAGVCEAVALNRNGFGNLLRGKLENRGRKALWEEMRKSGMSFPEIAEACGVSSGSVQEKLRKERPCVVSTAAPTTS